jgi:tRNA A37 N6-isopentenylltransferase MiaA
MSKGISDTLNMKSLEEILAETEMENEIDEAIEEMDDSNLPAVVNQKDEPLMNVQQMKGLDHSKAMDEIHDEALDVARKIVDMGMNIDPTRAPRILEVANQWFKTAADAKISKRDSQLKLMKIIQDQKKLELEERKLNGELGKQDMIEGEIVYEGDRNKLLKILKAQKDAHKDQPE